MIIRRKAWLLAAAVGCAAGLSSLTTNSIAAQTSDREHQHHERRKGLDKIKHIVFIVKENFSFDNYSGTFPGADGAISGKISTGEVMPLRHAPDMTARDIDHSYQAAVKAMDGGAVDRSDLIAGGNRNGDFLANRGEQQRQDRPCGVSGGRTRRAER